MRAGAERAKNPAVYGAAISHSRGPPGAVEDHCLQAPLLAQAGRLQSGVGGAGESQSGGQNRHAAGWRRGPSSGIGDAGGQQQGQDPQTQIWPSLGEPRGAAL